MARKGILLTLAAIAVGLLVLGTILTPEERGYTIYGKVTKYHGDDQGVMLVCWDPNPTPMPPCVEADLVQDRVWEYRTVDLPNGEYSVWAEYEDELEICTSARYYVQIQDGDVLKDIPIYWYECEDKP